MFHWRPTLRNFSKRDLSARTNLGEGAPRTRETQRHGSDTAVLAGYVVLCLLSLLPFIVVEHPPIVDFANHSARLFLACNAADPGVAAMYNYRLGIIPNLAADAVNLPLCSVVTPATLLKGVTVAALLLIYASGWVIQRKLFGRANAFLFLLPAIGLNLVTTMGYINYLAGVAVAMLLIAITIGREQSFKSLVLLCNIGGLVLFFCHIFSLAFAVVFFFGVMLSRRPTSVKAIFEASLRTGALFALPLALIAFVPEGQELTISYSRKIRLVAAPFMAPNAGAGILGVVLIAAFYVMLRNRVVHLHNRLRTPIIALAAYALFVPSAIGGAIDVDSRTLVAVAYLLFAAIQPVRRERAAAAVIAAVAAAFAAVQVWATFAVWQPFSREVAEFRRSLDVLPMGAAVFSVADRDRSGGTVPPIAYTHLTSYATIDRLIFNPAEFTGEGMQPLSVTKAYAALDAPSGFPFKPETAIKLKSPQLLVSDEEDRGLARSSNSRFALNWQKRFDYVIYYHFGGRRNFDPSTLALLHGGSFFSILKVRKAGAIEQASHPS